MEAIISFAIEHAQYAHWFFCILILLGGLNVPVSEDVVLITAGTLSSSSMPELAPYQFLWLFLACWIAAWEAYWIGRLLGPKLYRIKWFSWILTPKKIDRLHVYYEKFGVFTFLIGRFIPGGIRNCLFMTSGLGKMPFTSFILRDFPACLLSAGFLFYIGFLFGQNVETILSALKTYHLALFVLFATFCLMFWVIKRKQAHPSRKG